MRIFEPADEARTILPVEVPEIDILSAFEGLVYDPETMPGQVSAQYIYGILDMYRDAGGEEDILGKVIEKHIEKKEGWDEEKIRKRLSPGPIPWKPRMIPWALYEIILEESRVALEKEKKGKEEAIPTITPTMFPFLLGVYSLVAHPLVVLQSGYTHIEGLIENVNSYGRKLNTVTRMKTVGEPVLDTERRLMAVTFHRTQEKRALEDLESVIRRQGRDEERTREVVDAICRRDVATTMGALVGGSILRGQRLEEIKMIGSPKEEAEITIYYPLHKRGRIIPANIGDAIDLMMQRKGSDWRTAYLEDRLSTATAPLYALAAVKAKKKEREHAATLARAEAVLAGLGDLSNLTNRIEHHVRNGGLKLLKTIEGLYFDEESIFGELTEATTEVGSRFYQGHRRAIKATRRILITEEEEAKYGQRYDEYKRNMERLNEELEHAQAAKIPVLRERNFRMIIGDYETRIISRSGNLVREMIRRMRVERSGDSELLEFLDHVGRIDEGFDEIETNLGDLFTRIKEIPKIAEGGGYREKEVLNIYEMVEGIRKQFESDEVEVRNCLRKGQIITCNRSLLAETIENCVQNGQQAIRRSIRGEEKDVILLWYDDTKKIIYEANTGPEVSAAERRGMFIIGETGARRSEHSRKIALALAKKYLQAGGNDIVCYERAEIEGIRKEYARVLGEYTPRVNVVFGIKCN